MASDTSTSFVSETLATEPLTDMTSLVRHKLSYPLPWRAVKLKLETFPDYHHNGGLPPSKWETRITLYLPDGRPIIYRLHDSQDLRKLSHACRAQLKQRRTSPPRLKPRKART